VTLVERVTGATLIGKLRCRRAAAVNRRVIELIQAHPGLFQTITVDNGPEFHGYQEIERATGVTIYFATPYASWERGTNENTNGLIRQYIPKRTLMKRLTQDRCNTIAGALNNRPRKRHGFRTPLDRLADHGPLISLTSTVRDARCRRSSRNQECARHSKPYSVVASGNKTRPRYLLQSLRPCPSMRAPFQTMREHRTAVAPLPAEHGARGVSLIAASRGCRHMSPLMPGSGIGVLVCLRLEICCDRAGTWIIPAHLRPLSPHCALSEALAACPSRTCGLRSRQL
jgi:hypothetical protein